MAMCNKKYSSVTARYWPVCFHLHCAYILFRQSLTDRAIDCNGSWNKKNNGVGRFSNLGEGAVEPASFNSELGGINFSFRPASIRFYTVSRRLAIRIKFIGGYSHTSLSLLKKCSHFFQKWLKILWFYLSTTDLGLPRPMHSTQTAHTAQSRIVMLYMSLLLQKYNIWLKSMSNIPFWCFFFS